MGRHFCSGKKYRVILVITDINFLSTKIYCTTPCVITKDSTVLYGDLIGPNFQFRNSLNMRTVSQSASHFNVQNEKKKSCSLCSEGVVQIIC